MARIIYALVYFAVLYATAHAHDSWINHQNLKDPISQLLCCHEHDCAIVPEGGVTKVRGGYLIAETGETIPDERVISWAPDGHYWRCKYLDEARAGLTRCLIAPMPNT